MFKAIKERLNQGYRTIDFPKSLPLLSDRYRGAPTIDSSKCPDGCKACAEACPTDAITIHGDLKIDLGRCLFCTDCQQACPEDAVAYSTDHRFAVRNRDDLIINGKSGLQLAEAIDEKSRRIFGRSLQLRQVSAAGCNGCEADINVLGTVVFDIGRFGIHIVASPRHADGLIVTGPVSQNMKLALKKTYDATPAPKFVIAVGACAISGGPFVDHDEQNNGCDSIVPVDMYIPGCPPHPLTILDGILRLLGRMEDE
jgi:Ni,Fe-hydrogenase III small subunit/ferredoxin